MTKKNKVGQITIKKIGKKYAVCISGTPQELFNSFLAAKKMVYYLREKYGRRNYEHNNNHTSKRKVKKK